MPDAADCAVYSKKSMCYLPGQCKETIGRIAIEWFSIHAMNMKNAALYPMYISKVEAEAKCTKLWCLYPLGKLKFSFTGGSSFHHSQHSYNETNNGLHSISANGTPPPADKIPVLSHPRSLWLRSNLHSPDIQFQAMAKVIEITVTGNYLMSKHSPLHIYSCSASC